MIISNQERFEELKKADEAIAELMQAYHEAQRVSWELQDESLKLRRRLIAAKEEYKRLEKNLDTQIAAITDNLYKK